MALLTSVVVDVARERDAVTVVCEVIVVVIVVVVPAERPVGESDLAVAASIAPGEEVRRV